MPASKVKAKGRKEDSKAGKRQKTPSTSTQKSTTPDEDDLLAQPASKRRKKALPCVEGEN